MAVKSFRQALNEAIRIEMQRDPNVIVFGEDVCGGTGGTGEQDAWGGAFGVTKGLCRNLVLTGLWTHQSQKVRLLEQQ